VSGWYVTRSSDTPRIGNNHASNFTRASRRPQRSTGIKRVVTAADPELLRDLDEYLVHGRHPAGGLLAAEVPDVLQGECCVWGLDTGELVWRPRAHSISWSADGTAVALLTGEYGDDFELRSWPDRDRISKCAVKPPACCNTYVSMSPRGDRAGVLWWHQTEGGVSLVALEERPRSISRMPAT
jgi:hypothetical protein